MKMTIVAAAGFIFALGLCDIIEFSLPFINFWFAPALISVIIVAVVMTWKDIKNV